jgi:hypothetical protein
VHTPVSILVGGQDVSGPIPLLPDISDDHLDIRRGNLDAGCAHRPSPCR